VQCLYIEEEEEEKEIAVHNKSNDFSHIRRRLVDTYLYNKFYNFGINTSGELNGNYYFKYSAFTVL
jgi:hypothetical protein